jgi:ribosomal protein L7/L12
MSRIPTTEELYRRQLQSLQDKLDAALKAKASTPNLPGSGVGRPGLWQVRNTSMGLRHLEGRWFAGVKTMWGLQLQDSFDHRGQAISHIDCFPTLYQEPIYLGKTAQEWYGEYQELKKQATAQRCNNEQWVKLIRLPRPGNIIQQIKELRVLVGSGLGLKDAKNFCEGQWMAMVLNAAQEVALMEWAARHGAAVQIS